MYSSGSRTCLTSGSVDSTAGDPSPTRWCAKCSAHSTNRKLPKLQDYQVYGYINLIKISRSENVKKRIRMADFNQTDGDYKCGECGKIDSLLVASL